MFIKLTLMLFHSSVVMICDQQKDFPKRVANGPITIELLKVSGESTVVTVRMRVGGEELGKFE